MDRRKKHTSSTKSPCTPRLRILEPELPTLPYLPKSLKKEDFNDSDSSCVSSYYIPGITEKARCLEQSPSSSSSLRKSKKPSARELYVPSLSSAGDDAIDSFSKSCSSLPPMDVNDDDEEDAQSLLARSLPTDLSMDDLDAAHARKAVASMKIQLETQLGSIRGLLEEHSSRDGVRKFKALQEKKRNRKQPSREQSKDNA